MTTAAGPSAERVKWALAYVAGRLRGYARGSITLPNAAGAVAFALQAGAPVASVTRVLEEFGLRLDLTSGTAVLVATGVTDRPPRLDRTVASIRLRAVSDLRPHYRQRLRP
jgi:hypothetical protein